MKETISTRQICFILFAYNAATKMLLYPTFAADAAGNALAFPVLFDILVQAVIIWSIAFLSSRTQCSFFDLMKNTFGTVTARIFYVLFALYFLLGAIVPINEQQLLVHDSFYDTLPSLWIFLPFFIFAVYAGVKSFTNVGRCADLCMPIFVFCIFSFLLMSFEGADFSNLLPVLKQPFSKLAGLSLSSLYRFSDSAFLLIFMGHYKYRKGDAAKITVSYVAGGLAVAAFITMFYCVYGNLTATRSFALSNISVFFPAIGYVGRIDLFLLYAFDLVALFAEVLHIQAFVHCLCKAFDKNVRIIYSVIASAVLIAVMFIVNNKFFALQQAAAKWFWIPAVVFAYVIPVLAWTLRRKPR